MPLLPFPSAQEHVAGLHAFASHMPGIPGVLLFWSVVCLQTVVESFYPNPIGLAAILQVEASGDSMASSASGASDISASSDSSGMSSMLGGLSRGYHVRVLIPVYQEDFELVQRTLLAAREAGMPAGQCCRPFVSCLAASAVLHCNLMLMLTASQLAYVVCCCRVHMS